MDKEKSIEVIGDKFFVFPFLIGILGKLYSYGE